MIQITPQMRILVAIEPTDFRRGIDGLARVCKEVLRHDPFSGCLFVFRNRPATALKILVYDGQGFWLCHKRLSSGRFRCWPTEGAADQASSGAGRWRPISCKFSWRPAIRKPFKRPPPGGRSGIRRSWVRAVDVAPHDADVRSRCGQRIVWN